ncbi:unnamed protein product [Scytosiphon promiscuus]
MDASDSRPSPTETDKGNEAATVVVAAAPTPAPISEHSPAALPAPPSSSENITKPTSPALPPSPPPVPPRCLGARGYDGGFYDVGSFFVFRHGPQPQQVSREESPASAEGACGGDLVELFGASPASNSSKATTTVVPSPLHFELLDGLWVRGAAARSKKGEVQGSGPEAAARAFVLLQRQVDFLGRALGCAGSSSPKAKKARSNSGDGDRKGRDESAGAGESGANGVRGGGAGNGVVAELFALSNTDDNDSLQGLVCSGGSLWIGKFGLPPTPPGQDESEVVDLWPRKVARVVGGGSGGGNDPDETVVVRPLEGKPDAVGPLTVLKEENGGGDSSGGGEASEIAAEVARRAHELIGANGAAVSDRRGSGGSGGGGLEDDGAPRGAGRKGKASSVSAMGDSEEDDTEEESVASRGGTLDGREVGDQNGDGAGRDDRCRRARVPPPQRLGRRPRGRCGPEPRQGGGGVGGGGEEVHPAREEPAAGHRAAGAVAHVRGRARPHPRQDAGGERGAGEAGGGLLRGRR